MEKINCPICNNNKFKYILTGKDFIHHKSGNFIVEKCTKCTLMITNPRPDSKEIKRFYPKSYKPYKTNYKNIKQFLKFKNKYSWIFNLLDQKSNVCAKFNERKISMLEIGCGAGNFLYEQKLLHPNWDITGTDISIESIKKIKKQKINAFVSNIIRMPLNDSSIDVVYGWMVLEHTHNINKALAEIKRVLKKNGKFYFSVPNAGSWELKLFGKYWYGLHLPAHLYHFTEETITKIIEKNGFIVDKIVHQNTFANIPASIKTIINESKLPKILTKIFEWNIITFMVTLPISKLLSYTKQSGRITVLTHKK